MKAYCFFPAKSLAVKDDGRIDIFDACPTDFPVDAVPATVEICIVALLRAEKADASDIPASVILRLAGPKNHADFEVAVLHEPQFPRAGVVATCAFPIEELGDHRLLLLAGEQEIAEYPLSFSQ
jgi:hypothetical protein